MSMFKAYCDGYGTLVCHCGGDLCVCGDDGQDCFGCEKCDRPDDEYLEDDPAPDDREPHGVQAEVGRS